MARVWVDDPVMLRHPASDALVALVGGDQTADLLALVAEVEVDVENEDGSPASVYANKVGGSPLSLPLTVTNGRVRFYIEPGTYTRTETADGFVPSVKEFEVVSGASAVAAESGHALIANAHGIEADGSTDDTAAWEALIADLDDGQLVTWYGNSKVQPGLQFDGPVPVGLGPRSAFTIAGGDSADDGIILGGAALRAGLGPGNFSVIGGAAACRDAVVLKNLLYSTIYPVYVKVGTSRYAFSVEGCIGCTGKLISPIGNMTFPYSAVGVPAGGLRVVGSALIPSNANKFWVVLIGDSTQSELSLYMDGTVGNPGDANNTISGIIEGEIATRHAYIKSCRGFYLPGLHMERLGGGDTGEHEGGIEFEDCAQAELGPSMFVRGVTKLTNSDDMRLLGLRTTDLEIDADCFRTDRSGYNEIGNTPAYSNLSPTTFSNRPLVGELTVDLASIPNGASFADGFALAGASKGDLVDVSFTGTQNRGVSIQAAVETDGTIGFVIFNQSGSAWNPGSETLRFEVRKRR